MRARRLLFVNLVVIFFGRFSTALHCDQSTTAMVDEGNLGQTPDFNWLGVLRVHLHDGEHLQIAISGIVLIRERYALANADDVVRIPQRVFRTDTKAMFIPNGDTPLFVPPVSYMTHPEYEYSTYNSIALIELNMDDVNEDVTFNPICFPTSNFNTSKYLYLTGYTDENMLLEKVIYKIKYLDKSVCEEFYNRAGLADQKHVPSSYLCGFSQYNSTQCVWDNGMVLVSNATGWFTLIGFGVRGPGCAAPARFIDLSPYYDWISRSTGEKDEIYDIEDDYRRDGIRGRGDRIGGRGDRIEFIPTHDLFRSNTSKGQFEMRRMDTSNFLRFPSETDQLEHFHIEHLNENYIGIFPVDEIGERYPGACEDERVLLYSERFEIKASEHMRGKATYKLSFYDLRNKICVCVKLNIKSVARERAYLAFKEEIDFGNSFAVSQSEETPEEIFKYYPIHDRTLPPPTDDKWKPPAILEPSVITDNTNKGKVLNYDLYIRFDFAKCAEMKFDLYAAVETIKPSYHDEGANAKPKNNTKTLCKNTAKPGRKTLEGLKVKDPLTGGQGLRLRGSGEGLVADHKEIVSEGSLVESNLEIVLAHFVLSIFMWRTFFVDWFS